MFGFSIRFVAIKRVANLKPNIMFVFEQNAWNNKLSFWSHYPTAALRRMPANSLFSDYLIDYNNFKNILLGCDRFEGFIQMLLKYTPKCILLAK